MLPDKSGLGKVSHYVGTLMGQEAEWEGKLVEWKPKEVWAMKATSGRPARMNMQNRMRFEDLGPGRTRVTCTISYDVPYPVMGPILDRIYLRRRAEEHTNNAIEGMRSAAKGNRVPPLGMQIGKRRRDHPGYEPLGLG